MRRALFALVALCACASDERPAGAAGAQAQPPGLPAAQPETVGSGGSGGAPTAPSMQRSTRSSLQWKRYAVFESDLAAALELSPDELCREFGVEPCIRGVHLGPLGGHDIRTGLLESPAEPLITTPTVVERVVLSACLARVEKERKEGVKVFAGLDLAAAAPEPGSPFARELVTSLVKRFWGRDPSDEEREVLGGLARNQAGAALASSEFAVSVCLALGSSTEFLFF